MQRVFEDLPTNHSVEALSPNYIFLTSPYILDYDACDEEWIHKPDLKDAIEEEGTKVKNNTK